MSTHHVIIHTLLHRTQVALDNARSVPGILTALSAFGYDQARLDEGVALLNEAWARHAAQKPAYGAQYAATQALRQARQTAHELYMMHRRLTSLVLLGDAERQRALGLHQARKRGLVGWLGGGLLFYTNTLQDAETLAALARFNVTPADLAAGLARLEQVVELKGEQERRRYAAHQATQARDAALGALKVWMREFEVVARIALADRPQHLEALQLKG